MIEKLNWKHYAAAVLLALFSIPVAFLASSDMPIQPLADQSSAKKDTQNRPEPKNETTAQLPATSTGAAPEPARPAPAVEYPDLLTPDETTVKRRPSEPSRGDRKVRRVGSPQPAPAKEPVRPSEKSDDDRKDEKKDDKKKEKKGGLFDKVKGGIKKINPFKKD